MTDQPAALHTLEQLRNMDIDGFSRRLNMIWDYKLRETHLEDVAIPALGLVGEAGEVSEHFKKYIRDGKPIKDNTELALELGDVLHYWCRLVHLAGFDPAEIMALNESKLAMRRAEKAAGKRKDNGC